MLINDLPKVMINSLLITIIVEVIVSILLKYRKKDIINIILVNIITNPLLNSIIVYINVYYGLKVRNIALFFLEIMVVLIEGMIYQKYLERKNINAYILSFILNLLSFTLGMIINNFIY